MELNLFDKYDVVDDIRLLILLLLEEDEIHWIMSNVDRAWNSLCKSTFSDDRFEYKFIKYYQKLRLKRLKIWKKDEKKPRKLKRERPCFAWDKNCSI